MKKTKRKALKLIAFEYGITVGGFDSKRAIRKRINDFVRGVPAYYSPDNIIWPRPPEIPSRIINEDKKFEIGKGKTKITFLDYSEKFPMYVKYKNPPKPEGMEKPKPTPAPTKKNQQKTPATNRVFNINFYAGIHFPSSG